MGAVPVWVRGSWSGGVFQTCGGRRFHTAGALFRTAGPEMLGWLRFFSLLCSGGKQDQEEVLK